MSKLQTFNVEWRQKWKCRLDFDRWLVFTDYIDGSDIAVTMVYIAKLTRNREALTSRKDITVCVIKDKSSTSTSL